MLEIRLCPIQNQPDHYYASDQVIRHERLDFEMFTKAFGGTEVTNLQERSRFKWLPEGYRLWRTAHGHYRCVRPD